MSIIIVGHSPMANGELEPERRERRKGDMRARERDRESGRERE